jgi:hypothetical protein
MQSYLENQIWRNAHVYIDDLMLESTWKDDLLVDLTKTVANMQRCQIKLNPLKSVNRTTTPLHRLQAWNRGQSQ